MQDRAELCGGCFRISFTESGTTIVVAIPANPSEIEKVDGEYEADNRGPC